MDLEAQEGTLSRGRPARETRSRIRPVVVGTGRGGGSRGQRRWKDGLAVSVLFQMRRRETRARVHAGPGHQLLSVTHWKPLGTGVGGRGAGGRRSTCCGRRVPFRLRALPTGSTLIAPRASRIPLAGWDPGCPVFSDKGEKNHFSLISSEFIICRYLGKVFKAVGLFLFKELSQGRGRLRRGSPGGGSAWPPGWGPAQAEAAFGKSRGKLVWAWPPGAGSSESRSLLGSVLRFWQSASCALFAKFDSSILFLALLSKCESEIDA